MLISSRLRNLRDCVISSKEYNILYVIDEWEWDLDR